jgi:hypothetical protein
LSAIAKEPKLSPFGRQSNGEWDYLSFQPHAEAGFALIPGPFVAPVSDLLSARHSHLVERKKAAQQLKNHSNVGLSARSDGVRP